MILVVNFQPRRTFPRKVGSILAFLKRIDGAVCDEQRGFITFEVKGKYWTSLKKEIATNPFFAESTIITRTGSLGWNDYRLLHHFDKTQPLDKFDKKCELKLVPCPNCGGKAQILKRNIARCSRCRKSYREAQSAARLKSHKN